MSPGTEASATHGVVLRFEQAVATLTVDLPQPKNAFRTADARSLAARLDEALEGGARCVVLRGAGPAFCAGWDIASIRPDQDDPVALIGDVVAPLLRKLRSLTVPTIAAVAGPALGFGFGLALSCDLCLAAEDALFGSPFRAIGMVPDSGTHYFLQSRLGPALAAELIYTGRLLAGSDAAQMRLINRAVPAGALGDETARLAAGIAAGPTQALRLSKEILLAGGDFDAVLAHEARQLRQAFATADLQEGIAAFQQRRKPAFTGR